jgi:hypothetical protein
MVGMARKPNYRFDRLEKDRAKAAKKAERLKARQERSTKVKQAGEGEDPAETLAEVPVENLDAEPRRDED